MNNGKAEQFIIEERKKGKPFHPGAAFHNNKNNVVLLLVPRLVLETV
jgi:hypothetical protein